ncbi:uncharacterized protein Dyak_GE28476 [Drosophila yakuba]|uniref:Uncharacterized protein n=1 Tax=Drosophila yakuba TaxID=7245 RepID=A0A0R1DSH4_DROYA|nr:uncharacterized protein Dyak_GE28476 [Drosophila yakuba]
MEHRSQITAFAGKWERAELIAPLRAWSWELAVGSWKMPAQHPAFSQMCGSKKREMMITICAMTRRQFKITHWTS